MALKDKQDKKRGKRGVLLTLLTIVIFILMLGEVITYVVLNINYDNLSASVAQSIASGNFAQSLNSGMSAFLYSSLTKSIAAYTNFESNPQLRYGTFINNTDAQLAAMITNGSFYGNSSYVNASFEKEVYEFKQEALDEGFTANMSNLTLYVKQVSPFRMGVYVTGFASLNTSDGIVLNYPIHAYANTSINSGESLIAAEQGMNETLQQASLPYATIVGNLTAVSGSTSPFMFAYGKVIYMSGEPACVNVPSQYTNGNYILAIPNAADIGQNVCGMAGLITNISNSTSAPLKPYLVYKNDSIMSYLQTGPNLLINGAGLALLNTSQVQSSVEGGFYYSAPYTASYSQRVEGKPYLKSQNGIFSFRSVDSDAANFTAAGQNITIPAITQLSGSSSATISAWVYLNKLASHQIILSDDWSSPNVIQMYIHSNGALEADFGSGSSWIDAAETNPGSIEPGKWYLVTAMWASGKGENISINGVNKPISYIVGNSLSTGTLGTPGSGNIAANQGNGGSFDGFISNLQIYNTSISHATIYGMYMQGMDSMPVTGNTLVAWYPLYSNANDYSGNGNNGVPTNVIFTSVKGYTLNPTGQQLQNYVSKSANFNGQDSSVIGNASYTFPFTAVAWVYPINYQSTLSNLKTIMEFDGSPGSNGGDYQFFVARPGSSYCSGIAGTLFLWNPNTSICTDLVLPQDKLSMVAFTVNSTGMSIFLNGKIDYSTGAPYVAPDTYTQFVIGEQGDRRFFNGTIDNMQLYSGVLNLSELDSIYRAGAYYGPSKNSSIIGWWPLSNNTKDYINQTGSGTAVNVNYTYQELPASTSPLEGVLGCDSMDSCNSSAQRLYLSALPLENAGLGYMNASTAMGMQDALMPDAMSFNGTAYAYAPIGSYFGNNNDLTASAWVYATPNTNGPIFGVTDSGAASGGWNMPFLSENGLELRGWIWGVDGNNPINYTVPHAGWYNLIISYNATAGSETFYVDGNAVGSGTGAYSSSGAFDYWTTYITGAKPANVNPILSGTISDLQLYNVALSPSQAIQLYDNNSVLGVAPADYWLLGTGNGNLLNESENIVNASNYALLYKDPVVACNQSFVVNGGCGAAYVPG